MQPGLPVSSMPLDELIGQILNSHSITRDEEHRLMSALSSVHILNEDMQAAIQRIFYGMRHGLLRVVE
jgi:hypothetical protein